MDKPDVDSIEGLSPAISIDQKTTSRNPRSTVGTVTEIYDYLRLLYARVGHPHCPKCGRAISGQSIEQIVDRILDIAAQGTRFSVLAAGLPDARASTARCSRSSQVDGFARVRVDGSLLEIGEKIPLDKKKKHDIQVVVDRIVVGPTTRERDWSNPSRQPPGSAAGR